MEEVNNPFQTAVYNLYIEENSLIQSKDYHNLSDLVQSAIAKYKHHSSVLLIQSKIRDRYKFSFLAVSKTDVEKDIKNINPKKPLPKTISPPRILKESHKV